MKFEAVDTEELKDLQIDVDGSKAFYKVGEGETNHYKIPNDKKLQDSQFMIISKDGQLYIRDLAVVQPTRIKFDNFTEY